ncbi:MAG: peptidylprolyl isomerase [Clostridia bacterium]|nr:peptidylprolyl isomerase [Clostridia bacterium]
MKKIIALLLAVIMLASICSCGKGNNAANDGASSSADIDPNHSLVAIESENYKVTNGMLSYFYLYGFYNVYAQYSSYFQSIGFDVTKPLNEQQYAEDMTWHDYFVEMTVGDARTFVRVAEAAKADGYDDSYVEDKVQNEIDKITQSEGMTIGDYITKMFGNTLDEADLRAALSLQVYAYDYYEKLKKDVDSITTTADCEEYYNENAKTLNKVDYISYTVTASTANTDDTEAAYAEAKAKAEELVQVTGTQGLDGFKSWVSNYMTERNSESTAPLSDEDLENQIAKILAGTTDVSYTEESELAEWCFEDGRKAGDCQLTDNGAGSYTVTVIAKAPHRADDITKNVRHILFKPESYDSADAAKAMAEEILAQWKAGEATEESYDALAKEYNDDSTSLYENIYQGEMVDTFNDWLFDEARQVGDTGIVETDYGYHIMYFVGDGYPIWESEVRATLIDARLSEILTEYETVYALNENQEAVDKLPATVPQSALASSSQNVYE